MQVRKRPSDRTNERTRGRGRGGGAGDGERATEKARAVSMEGTCNKLLVLNKTHYGRTHDESPRQPMPCVEARLEVKRNRTDLPDSRVSQTDAIG